MRSNKHKRKINFKFLACLLTSFIVITYLSFNLISIISQLTAKQEEHISLKESLVSKEKLYVQYEKDVNQLKIPEYLAKYAREKYSLSKDGEIIFKTD